MANNDYDTTAIELTTLIALEKELHSQGDKRCAIISAAIDYLVAYRLLDNSYNPPIMGLLQSDY